MRFDFREFVAESNRIEGILRPPLENEIDGTRMFVKANSSPSLNDVATLALIYAPNKGFLRNQSGMDVRVGSHIPKPGGPQIYSDLVALLATIGDTDPFEFHVAYETLHPFMDGNGRTGRALWVWQMWRQNPQMLELGFLHAWYYQSIAARRIA